MRQKAHQRRELAARAQARAQDEPRRVEAWLAPLSLPRFVLTALLAMALLYGAYYYPYAPGSPAFVAIQAYLVLLAHGAAAVIGLFDGSVRVSDTLIEGSFPLAIVKSCSALDAQALYAAAALAFPVRALLKVVGVLLGLLGLGALNLLRIAGLYFVGAHYPAAFDALHEEVLPLLLVLSACLLFVLWVRWASHERSAATA